MQHRLSLNTRVDTKRPLHALILECFCLSIKYFKEFKIFNKIKINIIKIQIFPVKMIYNLLHIGLVH